MSADDTPDAAPRLRPEEARTLIGVCADDYGLTPGVSRGIRELLAARRISATSVMAASEHWPAEAASLRSFAGSADIGLHVTLTDQRPLGRMPNFATTGTFPPLPVVLRAGLARRLPLAEIEAEIERQLAAFMQAFGAPPAHLDGHHHVHQLPGIREIVLRIAQRLRDHGTYVRTCREPLGSIVARGVALPKALLISSLGRSLARRVVRDGVPTNHGFSGVYDFADASRPVADLFARFLDRAGQGHLVMCHPGHVDDALMAKDSVVAPRQREMTFFLSEAWPRLLAERGIVIGPLRRLPT